MWNQKTFSLEQAAEYHAWIKSHSANYEIVELFVNNGYGVLYRALRKVC